MRPYLAIIRDAFREAFASRTLWILLVLITLFLLALLPLSYTQTLSTGVKYQDVKQWTRLINRLASQSQVDKPSPGKHMMTLLSEEMQESIRLVAEGDSPATVEQDDNTSPDDAENPTEKSAGKLPQKNSQRPDAEKNESKGRVHSDPLELSFHLSDYLNRVLDEPEFYDPDSWSDVELRPETTEILAEKALSGTEIAHRNRLLLEDAYPAYFRAMPQRAFQLTYLGYDLPVELAMRKSEFHDYIRSFVLYGLLFAFGTAGIMIAIMVTAPIIPQTFDPGSLSLLLSKPISRSLMFLSQYLGGLAFIGILAIYTFGGLCLILGFRMGYWDAKILYYVPAFMFIFAIYYAVSCLAGLIWRSTTLSIIVTIVFWLACATVAATKYVCDLPVTELQTKRVIRSEADMFAVRNQQGVVRWNGKDSGWVNTYVGQQGPELIVNGPVFDAKRKRIISQDGMIGGGPMPIDMSETISFAGAEDGWLRHEGPRLPIGVLDIKPHPTEGFIVFSVTGIYRFIGELVVPVSEDVVLEEVQEVEKKRPGALGGILNAFGGKKSQSSDQFERIGPDRGYSLFNPWATAVDPVSGDIALLSRGMLARFHQDADGQYRLLERIELEGDSNQPGWVAFGGQRILINREDDGMVVLNADSSQEISRQQLEGETPVKSIEFSSDGKFAAITMQNQRLWMFDAAENRLYRPSVKAANRVQSAGFDADNSLLYSDNWLAVRELDMDSMKVVQTWEQPSEGFFWFYRYILTPIHTIFPKPSKLNNTAQYLVTGDDTREDYRLSMFRAMPLGDMAETMKDSFPRVYLDPWPPVWNGLIFVTVVLGLGCFYIERQQY